MGIEDEEEEEEVDADGSIGGEIERETSQRFRANSMRERGPVISGL